MFVLIGVLELSFTETLMLGAVGVLVQSFYGQSRGRCGLPSTSAPRHWPAPWRTTFIIACRRATGKVDLRPLLLVLAAVHLLPHQYGLGRDHDRADRTETFKKIWMQHYGWSFPYYLGGAALAGMIGWLNLSFQWEASLLVLPVVYLIYRSYRLYLGKLDDEKRHVEEMADLHMRTIEALALAIEAKDHTTHDHLQRVRVYAIEVAKEMGLSPAEMEALQAASLLHDIGKLAVPEHIISKPGRLTPEEFEKMKIHPVVGAEILEHVRFPYPVVPIVRAHHEKWDGTGYPFGISKGEQIPVGRANSFRRRLSGRAGFRPAISQGAAAGRSHRALGAESGKAFDPKVVSVLQNRYRELERLVISQFGQQIGSKLSTEVKVERGNAPDAGFRKQHVQRESGDHLPLLHCGGAAGSANPV